MGTSMKDVNIQRLRTKLSMKACLTSQVDNNPYKCLFYTREISSLIIHLAGVMTDQLVWIQLEGMQGVV